MILLIFSAASVGILHSLAPGHWLPVVLIAKSRKWPLKKALLAACVTALGHIVLSFFLALLSLWVETHFFLDYEESIERYAGLALGVFGLFFAGIAFFTQWSCHGHTHLSAQVPSQKTPFWFLFTLGFSPCVAVLPVVGQAIVEGVGALLCIWVAFSLGVLAALLGSTFLAFLGFFKLEHPIFEHYGDVVAGCSVALVGFLLFYFSH